MTGFIPIKATSLSRRERRAAAAVPSRLLVREFLAEVEAAGGEIGHAVICLLERRSLGHLLLALVDEGQPAETIREALTAAWNCQYALIVGTLRKPAQVSRLFRAAAFPLPPDLPEMVPVWRGAAGIPVETAARGLSWSVRRDVACAFALDRNGGRDPVVLRRVVPRAAVLAVFDAFDDAEAVIDPTAALPAVTVDGCVEEWRAARSREHARKRAWCAQAARDLRARCSDPAFLAQWPVWRQHALTVLARRAAEAQADIGARTPAEAAA